MSHWSQNHWPSNYWPRNYWLGLAAAAGEFIKARVVSIRAALFGGVQQARKDTAVKRAGEDTIRPQGSTTTKR